MGRLQKFKGPEVLIRATAELIERDPYRNIRVLFCLADPPALPYQSFGNYRLEPPHSTKFSIFSRDAVSPC